MEAACSERLGVATGVADGLWAACFAREVEITLDLGCQHPSIVTVLATGITGVWTASGE